MAAMDYKNHTISASAIEKAADKWIANATISWTEAGRQYEHSIHPFVVKSNPDFVLATFPSREEADHYAAQLARAWVDVHIFKYSQKGTR